MTTNNKRSLPHVEELEETAELPVLPDSTAQLTDHAQTVVLPPIESGAQTQQLGASHSDSGSITEHRGEIEHNLRGLTTNLKDLEEKLRAKGEQLSIFEREVGARDRRIADLEQDVTRTNELLALTTQTKQSLQTRVEQLAAEARTAAESHRRQSDAHAALLRTSGVGQSALTLAEAQLVDLRSRTERYSEVLHSMEGRRQVFEGVLAERDLQLVAQQTQIDALRQELATRTQQASSQTQNLQSYIVTERGRVSELERQLAEARSKMEALELAAQQTRNQADERQQVAATRNRELERAMAEAAHQAGLREGELNAQLVAEQSRANELSGSLSYSNNVRTTLQSELDTVNSAVKKLGTELQDHLEMITALQEQLSNARARNENLGSDLAAAEERIRAAEAEMRQRDSRIEKLLAMEIELREQIARTNQSLQERDGLIGRLEGEAASSAAVLGNIQQNLERLGSDGSSNAATATPPSIGDQLARLLVRTEGETGIVHVLGRKTTIGRTPDNDLCIDADFISRHHAVILTSNAKTIVEDLNSTNGVYVNGARVSRRTLVEGDIITIGQTAFRFVLKPISDRNS